MSPHLIKRISFPHLVFFGGGYVTGLSSGPLSNCPVGEATSSKAPLKADRSFFRTSGISRFQNGARPVGRFPPWKSAFGDFSPARHSSEIPGGSVVIDSVFRFSRKAFWAKREEEISRCAKFRE